MAGEESYAVIDITFSLSPKYRVIPAKAGIQMSGIRCFSINH